MNSELGGNFVPAPDGYPFWKEAMNEYYEVPYKELGEMGRAIDAYVLASVRAERNRILDAYEKSYMYNGVIGDERIEHDRDYFLLLVKGENNE